MYEEESDILATRNTKRLFRKGVDFVKPRATTRARLRSQSPVEGESGLA